MFQSPGTTSRSSRSRSSHRTAAFGVALYLGRSIANSIDRLRSASSALARGDLAARAPESGPAELARARGELQRDGTRTSSSCSTRAASSSPGPATTCAPRSPRCRRCSRRSRTGSPSPTTTSRPCASRCARSGAARRRPVRARAHRRGRADARDREATRSAGRRVVPARARGRGESAARPSRGAHRRRLPNVLCAPEKVERVLFNLLTNALRHTPVRRLGRGRRRARRRGGRASPSRTPARGSPPSRSARVFDRFWRADPARPRPAAAPASGSRSPTAWSRRRAARSGPRTAPAGAPGSRSRFPSVT